MTSCLIKIINTATLKLTLNCYLKLVKERDTLLPNDMKVLIYEDRVKDDLVGLREVVKYLCQVQRLDHLSTHAPYEDLLDNVGD